MLLSEFPRMRLPTGMDRAVLASRLRELRKAAGLSQKAVADALCVLQPNYARWETGKMLLPAIHIPELAILFVCSVDDFFPEPSPEPPDPQPRRRPKK